MTTQGAVEVIQKKNIPDVSIFFSYCFFFHFFRFFSPSNNGLSKGDTTNFQQKDEKCVDIHWSTYAVLLAFCIKKVKQMVMQTRMQDQIRREYSETHKQRDRRDTRHEYKHTEISY